MNLFPVCLRCFVPKVPDNSTRGDWEWVCWPCYDQMKMKTCIDCGKKRRVYIVDPDTEEVICCWCLDNEAREQATTARWKAEKGAWYKDTWGKEI